MFRSQWKFCLLSDVYRMLRQRHLGSLKYGETVARSTLTSECGNIQHPRHHMVKSCKYMPKSIEYCNPHRHNNHHRRRSTFVLEAIKGVSSTPYSVVSHSRDAVQVHVAHITLGGGERGGFWWSCFEYQILASIRGNPRAPLGRDGRQVHSFILGLITCYLKKDT